MPSPGRSLELFYIDGRPDGMLTAELFNWTGHVLMTPRTQIAEALSRPEAGHAGVYHLLGEREGEPLAYVGEAEDVGVRLRQHGAQKEWWTQAVIITAAANKLNKAHVRYLEARLVAEARDIGRVPLENATVPARPSLSEADVAKMEAFLGNLLVVLPAVRVDMFIRRARTSSATSPAVTVGPPNELTGDTIAPVERFVLETRKHGLRATAVMRGGEFIVEQGSTARSSWMGGVTHAYSQLHGELLRAGVLEPHGERSLFAQSYAFASPSAAAAVIYGRAASGPSAWKLEGQDKTYKDWEAQRLARP